MKHILFFIFFLAAFGVFPAHASVKSDFTNHNAPSEKFYQAFFDVLVFDAILPAQNGVSDILNALTLENKGTAEYLTHIVKMQLWRDAGPAGFQGLGIDEEIGTFAWYDLGGYWYVKDLNVSIPLEGLHIFVTVEDKYSISGSSYVQLALPVFSDANGNGAFDLGDKGVFVASENDGPTDEGFTNAGQQILSKASSDLHGPKTNITNIFNGAEVLAGELFITGQSRDQGGSVMMWTKIIIDSVEYDVQTNDNYAHWSYTANVVAGSPHTLSAVSRDIVGNQKISSTITITVTEAVVPAPETPAPAPIPTTPSFVAGDLIKASGASVYYSAPNGKRYVFPNEKTYKTWYNDFLSVKTITDAELASIPIGGNVTYRPGVKMVKITTDPKVYAVDRGGVLRWVENVAIATALYGTDWAKLVDDVPDAFFTNYTTGASIRSASDYTPETARSSATSIGKDKGLE